MKRNSIALSGMTRYMVKLSTESKDAREKQLEEGYINDPPPPYEVT
uniref:Uncharacterized protein n=1 Tax=Setaria digitata TaxID=48799 RepID=A0A915PQF2_9BILA